MRRRLLAFTSFFLQIFSSVVEGINIFNAVDGPDSGVVTGIGVFSLEVQATSESEYSEVDSLGDVYLLRGSKSESDSHI
ncbi:hypothetical protein Tco_1188040 [Tanacetum coccineum]